MIETDLGGEVVPPSSPVAACEVRVRGCYWPPAPARDSSSAAPRGRRSKPCPHRQSTLLPPLLRSSSQVWRIYDGTPDWVGGVTVSRCPQFVNCGCRPTDLRP